MSPIPVVPGRVAALVALVLAATAARAQTPASPAGGAPPTYAETVQVTATRLPEPVDHVPTSIQVVTAEEMRDRGVVDLRGALALLAGVDVAPGGDGGPASSVPEFWGLKEFDAFLLVVDGVPWGGAFNPALPSLDLADVERIEVQRGPAPVMYGATSFVGVVQVVRRAPGTKGTRLAASGGSFGSGAAALATHLPTWAGFESSLAADLERQGFEDERTSWKRGHVLWRNRRSAGAGIVSFDVDGTLLRQEPASPSPRTGRTLSPLVPIDSNQNPLDAHLDEDRVYTRLGYERTTGFGGWTSTLSFTHSGQNQYRGFLTSVSDEVPNAAGFRAKIDQNDLYADTHVSLTGRSRCAPSSARTTCSAGPTRRATPSSTAWRSTAAALRPRSRRARDAGSATRATSSGSTRTSSGPRSRPGGSRPARGSTTRARSAGRGRRTAGGGKARPRAAAATRSLRAASG